MLAFLQGGSAARETAQAAIDFAVSQRPDGVALARAEIQLLSPVPRPESIREFMVFEQHITNCLRKFSMPRWLGALDERIDDTFGRKATFAYRMNRAWYERPVYYKGNRFSVVGDGAHIPMPAYTQRLDWELEFGIFLGKKGRDIPKADRPRAHRWLHRVQRFLRSRHSSPRNGRPARPRKRKGFRRRQRARPGASNSRRNPRSLQFRDESPHQRGRRLLGPHPPHALEVRRHDRLRLAERNPAPWRILRLGHRPPLPSPARTVAAAASKWTAS